MASSRLLFMLGGCDAYSYRPSRLPIIPNSPAQACGHGPQSRSDGRLRHISGSTIRAYQVGVSFLYTYLTSRLTSSAARSTASIDLVSAAAVSAAYIAKCNPPVFTPTHPIALDRMTGTEVQHSTSTLAVGDSRRSNCTPAYAYRLPLLHMFVIFCWLTADCHPPAFEGKTHQSLELSIMQVYGNSRVLPIRAACCTLRAAAAAEQTPSFELSWRCCSEDAVAAVYTIATRGALGEVRHASRRQQASHIRLFASPL